MKYKIKFQRTVEGFETCEASITADDQDGAMEKLLAGDFDRFLVVQSAVKGLPQEDFILELKEVNGK